MDPRTGVPNDSAIRALLVEQLEVFTRNRKFAGARYALAPHLHSQSTQAQRVLGDFSPEFDYRPLAQQRGLVVSEAFGEGLVLFRVKP